MAQCIADIMTRQLLTLPSDATLKKAHDMVRDKGIRHIPILDAVSGAFVGMLTQKRMIASVITMASDFGTEAVERRQKFRKVSDVMETDFDTVTPDEPLLDVINYFLTHKHGCLPVLDENRQLQGIVTSSDFVRLCARLLEEKKGA